MKTVSIIKKLWWFPMLGLLISCQRGTELKKTSYQAKAGAQINKMAKFIDASVRAARNNRAAGATPIRAAFGQFDLMGNSPWNNQYIPNNVDEVSGQFFQMMQSINNELTDEAALAQGVRVVNMILNYQNPAFVVSNRYLGLQNQYGMAYNQAFTTPLQTYSTFTSNVNAVSPYSTFMNNGYFGSLPTF